MDITKLSFVSGNLQNIGIVGGNFSFYEAYNLVRLCKSDPNYVRECIVHHTDRAQRMLKAGDYPSLCESELRESMLDYRLEQVHAFQKILDLCAFRGIL